MVKYSHQETVHNLDAPMQIVPEIIKLLNPKSVVDIGCGLGTFLYAFKQNGVSDVLGIDGPWANKDLLAKYLTPNEFIEWDLEKEISLKKKYDLAISLEVAEHVSKESAEIFVRNLVNAGHIIIFSAAVPFQGGYNHINEQWLTYWEDIFLKYGYVIHDVLRPLFWDNPKVFWWYKQNMVLLTPKDFTLDTKLVYGPMKNIIHYDLYLSTSSNDSEKSMELDRINKGKAGLGRYLFLTLTSIFGYNNLKKIKNLFTTNKSN